ncbi:hypothetical protein A2U01_0096015, partial [Trifolium medium]|nr:hypothetical protein [Trifolium medium]
MAEVVTTQQDHQENVLPVSASTEKGKQVMNE